MGKKNKRKRNRTSSGSVDEKVTKHESNPLLAKQEAFLQGLTKLERNEFFSPSIPSERRAELWMEQADLGGDLVDRFAWATPDETAMRILEEFSPLVEVGCGANAYWCRLMRQRGIDIVGYDQNLASGGAIVSKATKGKKHKSSSQAPAYLKQGGPEVLASKEIVESKRTLFLCYPDEEDNEQGGEEDGDEEDLPTSMGWGCLEHYEGEYIIHVGELFVDANYSMEQAPWGRSSAPEFQQRLASEFHCLLKVQLPNWLHVRDSISVWKRSTVSTIVFAAEDDSDDEEVEYRHIPSQERLPVTVAAPCLAHLLPESSSSKRPRTSSTDEKSQGIAEKSKVSPAPEARKSLGDAVEKGVTQEAKQDETKKEKLKKRKGHKKGVTPPKKASHAEVDLADGDWEELTRGRKSTDGKYVTPW